VECALIQLKIVLFFTRNRKSSRLKPRSSLYCFEAGSHAQLFDSKKRPLPNSIPKAIELRALRRPGGYIGGRDFADEDKAAQALIDL